MNIAKIIAICVQAIPGLLSEKKRHYTYPYIPDQETLYDAALPRC